MKFSSLIWSTSLIASFFFLQEIECILNGDLVKNLDQFKYLVAIQTETGSERELCGGTILNDYLILSAAHCFYDRETRKFVDNVIVRAHTRKNQGSIFGGIERTVEEVYILKSYMNGKDDDIAIVKVQRSLDLEENSHKLQKVELPRRGSSIGIQHRAAIIAGYGAYTFKNEQPYTDLMLRTLGVQIVQNRNCGKPKAMSSARYVCAKPIEIIQGTPKGFCNGNSGGPLVIKNGDKFQIVGVIEENAKNCDDGASPGLYMSVSKYLESFIDKVMNNEVDDTIIVQKITARKGSIFDNFLQ